MTRQPLALALAAGLLCGCTLEPAYQRPAPPVPLAWPVGPAYAAPTDVSLSDWRQVFPDPKLRRVIERALANSRDLRVAIAQIQASKSQYRVQRAALLPTIDASVGATTGRDYTGLPPAFGSEYANATTYSASVFTTAYELGCGDDLVI